MPNSAIVEIGTERLGTVRDLAYRIWPECYAGILPEERIGPILMTALVTALGLLPLAMGSGEAGREIEGPMAVVILGGLISSTVLNLWILPVIAARYLRVSK